VEAVGPSEQAGRRNSVASVEFEVPGQVVGPAQALAVLQALLGVVSVRPATAELCALGQCGLRLAEQAEKAQNIVTGQITHRYFGVRYYILRPY